MVKYDIRTNPETPLIYRRTSYGRDTAETEFCVGMGLGLSAVI
jgi:hypothetical protein